VTAIPGLFFNARICDGRIYNHSEITDRLLGTAIPNSAKLELIEIDGF